MRTMRRAKIIELRYQFQQRAGQMGKSGSICCSNPFFVQFNAKIAFFRPILSTSVFPNAFTAEFDQKS